MNQMPSWATLYLRFIIAMFVGVILGSIVQTQFNMAALQSIGVDIPLGLRIVSTREDLIHFGPIYAALFSVGFIISQAFAMLVARRLSKPWLAPLCAIAGATGLWVTFLLVNRVAPMPTLIAATRDTFGLLAMLGTAAIAGLVFGLLNSQTTGRARQPKFLIVVLGMSALALPGYSENLQAQAAAARTVPYHIDTIAEGLEHPWSLAFLPDGRMLVTERPGRLRLLTAQGDTQVASLSGLPPVYASGQAGLFDVLPSPQFEQNEQIFLSYACGNHSANHTCIAYGTLTERGLEDVEEIFRVDPAKRGDAHYGGRLAWLPDGTLIVTLGDGFDYREQAQNLGNHIGSIVRIHPDGSVPDDNPFIGHADVRPEIYSYGHRNIQGLVVDEQNQRLIAHEHGPRGGDELNLITAGANFGWPIATGGLDYTGARITPFNQYPGTIPPLLEWTPSIAPSGMALYTGELFPEWRGDLLVGALVDKEVRRVRLSADATHAEDVESLFGELEERIRDVRVGPEGAIYLLTDNPEGRVLKVTPSQ